MSRRARTRDPQSRRDARIKQPEWSIPKRLFKPLEVLHPEEVVLIHQKALELLRDFGIEMLSGEALDMVERAGGSVDRETMRVRLPPELVEEAISWAPRSFLAKSRDGNRDLPVGNDHIVYVTVSSAPNSSGLGQSRRAGAFVDFENFIKLAQSLNIVHSIGGYPVEPIDIPPNVRHLDCMRSILIHSDKVPRAYALGKVRIYDGLEMLKIAHGIPRESQELSPMLVTNISVNSPLRIDGPMLDGLFAMSRANQIVKITPFTLSGAMAPITLPGALVQQHAEALSGVVMTQLARKGSPVIYGCFLSNVDMKTGAPAFGTPEYVRGTLATGQLARHCGLPLRVSNANASNAVDGQAAYESQMSLWAAILSGGNFIQHACGWLEGGLVASFEKMIVDAEMLQMLSAVLAPISIDGIDEAIAAIREVGPGGHFFGVEHTLARYEGAFYTPLVSDWRNYPTWFEAGAPDTFARASVIAKTLLDEYTPPRLASDRAEALDEYVSKRKLEIGTADLD